MRAINSNLRGLCKKRELTEMTRQPSKFESQKAKKNNRLGISRNLSGVFFVHLTTEE